MLAAWNPGSSTSASRAQPSKLPFVSLCAIKEAVEGARWLQGFDRVRTAAAFYNIKCRTDPPTSSPWRQWPHKNAVLEDNPYGQMIGQIRAGCSNSLTIIGVFQKSGRDSCNNNTFAMYRKIHVCRPCNSMAPVSSVDVLCRIQAETMREDAVVRKAIAYIRRAPRAW
jgi:hypothetical protein